MLLGTLSDGKQQDPQTTDSLPWTGMAESSKRPFPPGVGAGRPAHPFAVTVEEAIPVRLFPALSAYTGPTGLGEIIVE